MAGRPRKGNTWKDLLVSAGNEKINIDGKDVPLKKAVSLIVMRALSTGRLKFVGGHEIELTYAQYESLLNNVIDRIDGPIIQASDITSGGESINAPVVYLPTVRPDDGTGDSE